MGSSTQVEGLIKSLPLAVLAQPDEPFVNLFLSSWCDFVDRLCVEQK